MERLITIQVDLSQVEICQSAFCARLCRWDRTTCGSADIEAFDGNDRFKKVAVVKVFSFWRRSLMTSVRGTASYLYFNVLDKTVPEGDNIQHFLVRRLAVTPLHGD